MKFIQGKTRTQSILFPQTLDQIVEQDNEVRIIDLFVESIHLSDFKFIIKTTLEGRPAFHPTDLLKLYVYGYLNSIRSSRVLEKELALLFLKINSDVKAISSKITNLIFYHTFHQRIFKPSSNRFKLDYLYS